MYYEFIFYVSYIFSFHYIKKKFFAVKDLSFIFKLVYISSCRLIIDICVLSNEAKNIYFSIEEICSIFIFIKQKTWSKGSCSFINQTQILLKTDYCFHMSCLFSVKSRNINFYFVRFSLHKFFFNRVFSVIIYSN